MLRRLAAVLLLTACGGREQATAAARPPSAPPRPAPELATQEEKDALCRAYVGHDEKSPREGRTSCLPASLLQRLERCGATQAETGARQAGLTGSSLDLAAEFLADAVAKAWGFCPPRGLCKCATGDLIVSAELIDKNLHGNAVDRDGLLTRIWYLVQVIPPKMMALRDSYSNKCSPTARRQMTKNEVAAAKADLAKAESLGADFLLVLSDFRARFPDDPVIGQAVLTEGWARLLVAQGATDERRRQEQRDEAKRDFETIIATDPEGEWAPTARLMLGAFALDEDDAAGALAQLDLVLAAAPNKYELSSVARYLRAESLSSLKRPDESIAQLEALAERPLEKATTTVGHNLDDECTQLAVFDLVSIHTARGDCGEAAELVARIRAAGIADCPEQQTDD